MLISSYGFITRFLDDRGRGQILIPCKPMTDEADLQVIPRTIEGSERLGRTRTKRYPPVFRAEEPSAQH